MPIDLRESAADVSDPRLLLPEWLRDRLLNAVPAPTPVAARQKPPDDESALASEHRYTKPQSTTQHSAGANTWPPLPASATGPIPPSALLTSTQLPAWLREIAGQADTAPNPVAVQPTGTDSAPAAAPADPVPFAGAVNVIESVTGSPPDDATGMAPELPPAINMPAAVALIVAVLIILVLAIWSLYG